MLRVKNKIRATRKEVEKDSSFHSKKFSRSGTVSHLSKGNGNHSALEEVSNKSETAEKRILSEEKVKFSPKKRNSENHVTSSTNLCFADQRSKRISIDHQSISLFQKKENETEEQSNSLKEVDSSCSDSYTSSSSDDKE